MPRRRHRNPSSQRQKLSATLRQHRLDHPRGADPAHWAAHLGLANAEALLALEDLHLAGDLDPLVRYLRALELDPAHWVMKVDKALYRDHTRRECDDAYSDIFVASRGVHPVVVKRCVLGPSLPTNPLGWTLFRRLVALDLQAVACTSVLAVGDYDPLTRVHMLISAGWLIDEQDGPALCRWLAAGSGWSGEDVLEKHRRWWFEAKPEAWKRQPPPGAVPETIVYGLMNGGYRVIASRHNTKKILSATQDRIRASNEPLEQVAIVMELVHHVVYDSHRRHYDDLNLIAELSTSLAQRGAWGALEDLHRKLLPIAEATDGVWLNFSLQPAMAAVEEARQKNCHKT